MYISRVKVLNFRSLAQTEVSLKGYTALVGLNDSGKSNFLRALNLFFNGQTDDGHSLSFVDDFSQQGKVIGGKAKQIEIEIEVMPPANYADKGPVIWRKTYRADNPSAHSDEIFKKDKSQFSKGSRTEYWLRHIAFEYVPAIRGNAFFTILKRRLYTTLAQTVAPKLTEASSTFLSDLRKEVRGIETESQRLLGLATEFSLPGDLGELIEVLDFRASDAYSQTTLQRRGDGIQGRHIPVILKFLADQRKINSAKGKPPSETIWGFEEPENNLELAKQIDVANEFREYSKGIQIIVSTHSPAFYGVAKNSGAICIACRDAGKTSFVEAVEPKDLDKHLGLMPFIEPYLETAVAERSKLLETIASLSEQVLLKDKAALYVEGWTDRTVIQAAFKSLGLSAACEIVAKDGMGGGVGWIVGCCIARAALTDLAAKTAALLDDDDAGTSAKAKIIEHCAAIGRPDKTKFFVVGKENGEDEIRDVKRSGIRIAYGIEEVCGREMWEYAETQDWLQERGQELMQSNTHLLNKDKSLSAVLDERIDDLQMRRLIEYKVRPECKGDFAKHFAKALEQGMAVPKSLEALVTQIHAYFK